MTPRLERMAFFAARGSVPNRAVLPRRAGRSRAVLMGSFLVTLAAPAMAAAPQTPPSALPVPRFADAQRTAKLMAAVPELDRIFREWQEHEPAPGLAYGLIVDGKLVHAAAFGEREVPGKSPATTDSVFRIASMTKSFTALAVLRLRDDGRLRLDDPVEKYVPELAHIAYPTSDSPRLTIRHLLSHSAGFPEDNPWGDQQLGISAATMAQWLRSGIPFSHAPGTAYEYSNYAFMILGRVIEMASGRPYRNYVDATIIRPLGMTSTVWEEKDVPPTRLATGERPDGKGWLEEPALGYGAGSSMGGLFSSVADLARFVSFFLDAYPPRDDDDGGPVRRSSRREMQVPVTPFRAAARRATVEAPLELTSGGYAFGLGVTQSCRFGQIVSHGGGLPGFGSRMVWLPEYGVGIVVLANRTYANLRVPVNLAFDALAKGGGLAARVPEPAPALLAARRSVDELYGEWSDAALKRVAASNLLLDHALETRRSEFAQLRTALGRCSVPTDAGTDLKAENALRGTWTLECERGRARFWVTLAPTPVPSIQYLDASAIVPLDAALVPVVTALATRTGSAAGPAIIGMLAPGADAVAIERSLDAARAWGTCHAGATVAGDGRTHTTTRLDCDRGRLDAQLEWDATTPRLKGATLSLPAEEICVP